jgi:putative transposase
MILNEFGKIARDQIEWMQNQYSYLKLHGFVVVPNHVHILMEIKRNGIQNDVGTGRDLSLPDLKIKSVSSIMGAYKTTTSKNIRNAGNFEFQLQRSFHDVIVRKFYKIHRGKSQAVGRRQQIKNPPAFAAGFRGCFSARVGIRTPNLLIRSQMLYPIELRMHIFP